MPPAITSATWRCAIAPSSAPRSGLSLDEAIAAELRGLQRGERDFGVITRMINCSLRHYSPRVSFESPRPPSLPRPWRRGASTLPAARPAAPAAATRRLRPRPEGRLGITVHAGEAAGAESIAEAIHLCHADRIGHGTRLHEDPRLRDYVRDRRIPIEINITSNLQTHAVARAAAHPVRTTSIAGSTSPSAPTAGSCAASPSPMNTGWRTPRSASPARRSTA